MVRMNLQIYTQCQMLTNYARNMLKERSIRIIAEIQQRLKQETEQKLINDFKYLYKLIKLVSHFIYTVVVG